MLLSLLALSVAPPQSMTAKQIDQELLTVVRSARNGSLFHEPTHSECAMESRRSELQERIARYDRLVDRHLELGGTLPRDDERLIMNETVHYTCLADASKSEGVWNAAMKRLDEKLNRTEALLERRRRSTH